MTESDAIFKEFYHDFTATWEGGKHQDPNDPGGATAYGVSFRFLNGLPLKLADFNGDGEITWADVMAMTPDDAAQIFHRYFWTDPKIDRLPSPLREAVFDTAVNCGRKRAVKWLQYLIGEEVDGIIGRNTLGTIKLMDENMLGPQAMEIVTAGLMARRRAHYGDLAARREWARMYYHGWLNRTAALEKMLLGSVWQKGKAA